MFSDCPSGTDEVDCESKKCKEWQFTCGDGHCIIGDWKCDGDTDCKDGSDENNDDCNVTHPELVLPKPGMRTGSDRRYWMRARMSACETFFLLH